MAVTDSSSLCKESLTLLEKRLCHFRSVDSLLRVGEKLFQKCPWMAKEMEAELDKGARGMNKMQTLWVARRILLRKVVRAINSQGTV